MRTALLNNALLRSGRGFAPRKGGSRIALVLPLMLLLVFSLNEITQAQNLIWAQSAGDGALEPDDGKDIAVDATGNAYVAGYFQNASITFGLGTLNETTLISDGPQDIFVAKYDAHGLFVWAKRAGGTGPDGGEGIAVDGSGNIYVTGSQFSGTFGRGEPNETILSGGVFVAKYDANGFLIWAKEASNTSSASGRGIAVDALGNSYVTGVFDQSVTFGPGEANQTTLTSSGLRDIFLAKYNVNGLLQWAKHAVSGVDDEFGGGIAIDAAGNSYVTGSFANSGGNTVGVTAVFGVGEANETTLISAGNSDVFVAKYDHNGLLQWAKRAGGLGSSIGNFEENGADIRVDGSGNSYVTGSFDESATFGPGEANETTLTGVYEEIFVAKYAANGALIWAKRASGNFGFDRGEGIAIDATGNSYVTGIFDGSVTFGPGEANETTLSGVALEIFVAKYGANGLLLWAKRAGRVGGSSPPSLDGGRSIVLDGLNNSYVTGHFENLATFGLGEARETTLTGGNEFEVFVAKYSASLLPTANAGPDQEVFTSTGSASVTLNGSGSSDPEPGPLTYTWREGATTIAGPTTSATSNVTLNVGAHTITLTVEDGNGGPDTDDVLITVLSISDGIDDASDMIDDVLAGGGLTDDAINELNDAQQDLQDAQDALAAGDIVAFFDELGDAAKDLQDAADEGAEVTDILELLLALARQTAEDARAQAVACPDPDRKNRRARKIANGDRDVAEALAEYAGGDYNDAIKEYGQAWEDFQDAIDLCPSYMPKLSEEETSNEQPVTSYQLEQNYPNPFNPSTVISFQLPEAGDVSLAIYNSNGQLVRTLVAGEKPAGRYSVLWDATDDRGNRVASGVYVYVLKAGDPSAGSGQGFVARKKLVLMK